VVKTGSAEEGAAEPHMDAGNVGAFVGVSKLLGILIGSTMAIPMKEVIKLTPQQLQQFR